MDDKIKTFQRADPIVSQVPMDMDKALDLVGPSVRGIEVEFERGVYDVTVSKGYGRRVPNPEWPASGIRYHWEGVPVMHRKPAWDADGPFVRYRQAKWSVEAFARVHESGHQSVGFEAVPR